MRANFKQNSLKYAVSEVFTRLFISENRLMNSANENSLTRIFSDLSNLSKGNKSENAAISAGTTMTI